MASAHSRISWCGRSGPAAPLHSLSAFAPQRTAFRAGARIQALHLATSPRSACKLRAATAVSGATPASEALPGQPSLSQPLPAVAAQEQQAAGCDAEFEERLQQLLDWKDKYYECLVPRRVHDAPELGEWVHALRRRRKQGLLHAEQAARLDAVGFRWAVDTVTAKWYSNLHAARQYKELHAGALPLPDHTDPRQPQWEEAGRWLERQRELYLRQKLLHVRVRLLKEVLGLRLERPRSKPRRNLHPVLRQGNTAFQAELARRRQQQTQQEQQQEGWPGA